MKFQLAFTPDPPLGLSTAHTFYIDAATEGEARARLEKAWPGAVVLGVLRGDEVYDMTGHREIGRGE